MFSVIWVNFCWNLYRSYPLSFPSNLLLSFSFLSNLKYICFLLNTNVHLFGHKEPFDTKTITNDLLTYGCFKYKPGLLRVSEILEILRWSGPKGSHYSKRHAVSLFRNKRHENPFLSAPLFPLATTKHECLHGFIRRHLEKKEKNQHVGK